MAQTFSLLYVLISYLIKTNLQMRLQTCRLRLEYNIGLRTKLTVSVRTIYGVYPHVANKIVGDANKIIFFHCSNYIKKILKIRSLNSGSFSTV